MMNRRRTGKTFDAHNRRNQVLLALLLTAAALVIADRAVAETGTNPVEFNIPAQSVPAALSEFARQARVQLFFISDGFEDIQANAVVGTYAAQQALDLLLADTGLAASISEASGVKVAQIRASTNSLTPGSQMLTAAPDVQYTNERDDPQSWRIEQESEDDSVVDSKRVPRELDEILVTGSRIRGAQNAAPVISITAEDIEKSGFATMEQLIRSVPQNFGGGASQANFTDSLGGQEARQFTGSEASIDLRGLGSDSTLILVNGRRMAAGGLLGNFTDVSTIPLSVIERVEILTDGASAIYGSEAVGGVVNFILLDNYEGAQTRLQAGPDFGTNTSGIRFGQLFGKSWGAGSLLLTYEYYNQDNLDAADRPQSANSDLRPFGGDDWSLTGGNPATIRVGFGDAALWYDIPAVQDGTSLAADDFVGLPSPQNLRNTREGLDLRGKQQRQSVYAKFEQEFSGSAEAFFETRYSKVASDTRSVQAALLLNVPGDDPATPEIEGNPFFVDPTGTGLTSVTIDRYSFLTDLGPVITHGDTESYGGTAGVLLNLGDSSWEAEFSASYAKSELLRRRSNIVLQATVDAALAQTDPQLAFNPFGDGSHTNPAVLEGLGVCCFGGDVDTDVVSINADFNGQLFELPSGPVSVATGLEYREESFTGITITDTTVTPGVDRNREVPAVYAEVFVPLVSPKTRRPGLERLELSIAGRYTDYSDFGDNVSPKVGVVWSPSRSVTVRGTYGESFKAPLLTDLDTSENSDSYFDFTPLPGLFRFGGNDELTAEQATTWTAGIQIKPQSIPGLNLDLTYFDIVFEDRILSPSVSLFDVFDPEFAAIVNDTPTGEEIIAVVSSPSFAASGTSADDIINGILPVAAIVDYRRQNFEEWNMSGLDIQLNYGIESNAGRFDLGLNGSYLFEINQALLSTLPSLDIVSTVSNPVDLRARGSLSWSKGHWEMSGFLNYTDSYTDDSSDPQRSIDSWATVDFQLTYDTQQDGTSQWLDNLRLSLSVQNLFDEDPPFVNRVGGTGFDPANASVFGRAISLQAVKTWK